MSEALDALSFLDAVSASGANSADLPPPPPTASPEFARQAKRQRTGGAAPGQLVAVKTEHGAENEGQDGIVPASPAATSACTARTVKLETTAGEGDKICNGCRRSRLHGVCYVTLEPLHWGLPDGRGSWCKD
eukprot:7344402-Pyramimonas_sp.AAC.1